MLMLMVVVVMVGLRLGLRIRYFGSDTIEEIHRRVVVKIVIKGVMKESQIRGIEKGRSIQDRRGKTRK